MSDDTQENCGIVLAHSLHDTYRMIDALNNRGRDAAGIAGVRTDGKVDAIKWEGSPRAFSLDTLHGLFSDSDKQYMYFFGHVRYATRGRKDKLLHDAHPHVIGGNKEQRRGHIIIRDADAGIVHNGQTDKDFIYGLVDNKNFETDCDTEAFLHFFHEYGIRETMEQLPGSYSCVIFDNSIDNQKTVALRDRHGIMPCWLGYKDGKYIVSSEDNAIYDVGGKPIREVSPGEAIVIDKNGQIKFEQVVSPVPRFCFFMFQYFMHENSTFAGIRIADFRRNLGYQLYSELPINDIDIVTYAPRAPKFTAHGYAERLARKNKVDYEKVFKEMLYKPRDERSFLQPDQIQRTNSIGSNLFVFDNINVENKTVGIIDDSIVRGVVSKKAVELVKGLGAKKVYYISATPPIGPEINGVKHGCYYGVDINPYSNEFAIRLYGSPEGIGKEIGAEVFYMSHKGLFKVFRDFNLQENMLCSHCIGGPKPF
jgi:amidophosphoribosyltransferase